MTGDADRLNKLVRKAGSVLGVHPDSLEEVVEVRMRSKIRNILVNPSHPLHEEMNGLRRTFSKCLLPTNPTKVIEGALQALLCTYSNSVTQCRLP